MRWIDIAVFVAFLVWVVRDGMRRAGGARTLEGYFAGDRAIPWWAAGLSVMATQASAITVIGTTGQGHDYGMEFVQMYFGLPFAMVLLCIFLVPLYRKQPILTAYEFLERRFGPQTRTLASAIFLLSRCLALGLVIYAPAVVLSTMVEVPITVTVLLMGVLTTLYTVVGGVQAVIWTDVKQMAVILGGLVLCLAILLVELLPDLGLSGLLGMLGGAGKLNALEAVPQSRSLVPRLAWTPEAEGVRSFWEERYNVWSGLLGGLFLHLSYFGCDQSQVQRILTNPSVRESRMALLVSAIAKVPMQLVVLFIGVLLYAFYAVHGAPLLFDPNDRAAAEMRPELRVIERQYEAVAAERRELALQLAHGPQAAGSDGALLERYRDSVRAARALRDAALERLHPEGRRDTNYVFPHFALQNLPPVVLGLILAAIFAAAMSSADSAFNSLTAASVVDFYRRWLRPQATEQQALRVSKGITLFWGVSATAAALFLGGGGSVIERINQIGSYFYGALLGVFALALVCKPAGSRASFVGLLAGMAAVLAVEQLLRIHYLWYNVIGCVAVLAVGMLIVALGLEKPRAAEQPAGMS